MARIQAFNGSNTTFASSVTTSSVTTTTGNTLVAFIEADTVTTNGISVSDSKGNTWSRIFSTAIPATFDLEVWVAHNITGGASHNVTATDNGGGVDSLIIVEEWDDIANPAIDVRTFAQGSSTSLTTLPSSPTNTDNEVVFGVGVISGSVTLTVGAGYSNLTQVSTAFSTLGVQSKTVSATGSQTSTMTSSASGSWIEGLASFKEVYPISGAWLDA